MIVANQRRQLLRDLSSALPSSKYNRVAEVFKEIDRLAAENASIKHENLVLSEKTRILSLSLETLTSESYRRTMRGHNYITNKSISN